MIVIDHPPVRMIKLQIILLHPVVMDIVGHCRKTFRQRQLKQQLTTSFSVSVTVPNVHVLALDWNDFVDVYVTGGCMYAWHSFLVRPCSYLHEKVCLPCALALAYTNALSAVGGELAGHHGSVRERWAVQMSGLGI